jgi:hypothetical protein
MKRLIKFLTLVFTLLVVFFSCSPKKEKADTSEIIYSEDVAQIISRITAGTLQPDDHISITFVEGVVADEQVGKEVKIHLASHQLLTAQPSGSIQMNWYLCQMKSSLPELTILES